MTVDSWHARTNVGHSFLQISVACRLHRPSGPHATTRP
ncbi:hypothetical protein EKH55_4503 [Sinorhizobium alkalisoli]|nr:hypothetical protein EKH55_4503 [Sinorhizobium alkalisoli]